MNEKELKKSGSQSWEVIDYFSEELQSDLVDEGYEGEALEEVFAKEKAALISAVNEFKEAVRREETSDSFKDMLEDHE